MAVSRPWSATSRLVRPVGGRDGSRPAAAVVRRLIVRSDVRPIRPPASAVGPLAGEPEDVHHPDGEPEDRPDHRRPGARPHHRSSPSPSSGGRANSSPTVVTREAHSHADRQGRAGSVRPDHARLPRPRTAIADGSPGDPPRVRRRNRARPGTTTRQGDPFGAPFIPAPMPPVNSPDAASRNFSQSRPTRRPMARARAAGLGATTRDGAPMRHRPGTLQTGRTTVRRRTPDGNCSIDSARGICYLPMQADLLRHRESGSSQSGDQPCRHPCAQSPTEADGRRLSRDLTGRRPPFVFGRVRACRRACVVVPATGRPDRSPQSGRHGVFRIGPLKDEPRVPCPIRARRTRRGWRRSGPA